MKSIFAALSDSQLAVLAAISIDEDQGHSEAIIEELRAKGLILGHPETPNLKAWWYMPVWVHVPWCEWCSEKYRNGEIEE